MMTLSQPLTGIIPPMITPLVDRDTLDCPGLKKLIEHILAGGVHGLFILGTTGEAPSLSYKLRYELIERTCEQVGGRVPILVGITDTSFVESVRIARFAADRNVSAVVVAPPYYYPAGQPELLEYLQHLNAELPLPVFLYNMPGCTKVAIEPQTVIQAAQLPAIAGLKDSSADMIYFHKIQAALEGHPNFTLLVGPEELLAESVLLGGHGGVCGGANIFPRLYVELYNAAIEGRLQDVRRAHQLVMLISSTIYSTGRYSSSFLKGVKCCLNLMQICNDFVAEPFHRFLEPERIIVARHFAKIRHVLEAFYESISH